MCAKKTALYVRRLASRDAAGGQHAERGEAAQPDPERLQRRPPWADGRGTAIDSPSRQPWPMIAAHGPCSFFSLRPDFPIAQRRRAAGRDRGAPRLSDGHHARQQKGQRSLCVRGPCRPHTRMVMVPCFVSTLLTAGVQPVFSFRIVRTTNSRRWTGSGTHCGAWCTTTSAATAGWLSSCVSRGLRKCPVRQRRALHPRRALIRKI